MPDEDPHGELSAWINATKYRQRAGEFLELADASDHHVRERYHTIAQHYLALAALEEQIAKREAERSDRSASLASEKPK
jgi:hypothetical protein